MPAPCLAYDRGKDGRPLLAYVESPGGALKLIRYDDAEPEMPAAVDTLVASGTQSVSLKSRRNGVWDLLWVESDDLDWRISRDQGVSWSEKSLDHGVLNLVTHDLDERTGRLGIAVHYPPGTSRWSFLTYNVDSAGDWGFVTPTPVIATAGGGQTGCLRRRRDGIWEIWFSVANPNVIQRRASRDGGATWPISETLWSPYQRVTAAYDWRKGMVVLAVYSAADSRWDLVVGTLDASGEWAYTTPSTLVTDAAAAGCIKRRKDGVWEFAYMTSAGDIAIIRCRNLSSSGAGSWS